MLGIQIWWITYTEFSLLIFSFRQEYFGKLIHQIFSHQNFVPCGTTPHWHLNQIQGATL